MFSANHKPEFSIPFFTTIIAIVCGFLSCIFSALSLLVLWKMRVTNCRIGIRISSVVMLLSLVTADWLRGFFNLTGMIRYVIIYKSSPGPDHEDACTVDCYCKIQSFFSIWFNMILFICIFFIGVFAIFQISGSHDERRFIKKKTLIGTTIFCWLIPFLLTLIPAVYNVLGEDQTSTTNGWCWITSCNTTSIRDRITFMLLYSKAFEAFIFIVNLTLFVYLQFISWKRKKLHEKFLNFDLSISTVAEVMASETFESITNDSKLLFFINISICFCHLAGLTRTVLNITNMLQYPTEELYRSVESILMVCQAIFENLQSLFVFLVLLMCSKFAKTFMNRLICQCKFNMGSSITSPHFSK